MGYMTRLTGHIQMNQSNFDSLMGIDNLHWRWDEKTIDEYLGQGWSYDKSEEKLVINAHRPMHNHPRFMGLLAWFQTAEALNTFEQEGSVQDAWFDSGRYFLKGKRWSYVGRGTMVVGPESVLRGPDDPSINDVHTWETAYPPLAELLDKGSHLSLRCHGDFSYQCTTEYLHELSRLTPEERDKPTVFADRITWTHGRETIVIKATTLWSHKCPKET